MSAREATLGVVLAGGAARRMGGGDKGAIAIAGRSALARVIERARPQCAELILNASGDPARFAEHGLEVVPDRIEGRLGPLAGVLSAMRWAERRRPEFRWVLTFAVDTPFFPRDLRSRLADARAPVALAATGGRNHPVFGLWSIGLADALERALIEEGVRKIEAFTEKAGARSVAFDAEPFDPFFNLNRPEDLEGAEAIARALDAAEPPPCPD